MKDISSTVTDNVLGAQGKFHHSPLIFQKEEGIEDVKASGCFQCLNGKTISEEISEILLKPIISLKQAIRLGRQLGAHFGITKPADKEVSTEVLDMLE